MLDKRNFYINGKWVKPSKSNDFEVINPSNEEPFAVISLGSKGDIDFAVKAAKNSFNQRILQDMDAALKSKKMRSHEINIKNIRIFS